jgi:hypothetical protein
MTYEGSDPDQQTPAEIRARTWPCFPAGYSGGHDPGITLFTAQEKSRYLAEIEKIRQYI